MTSESTYRDKLDVEKAKREGMSAAENVKAFFKENRTYIMNCYNYYVQYNCNKGNFVNVAQNNKVDEFRSKLKGKIILVLTANPYEEGVLIHGLVDAAKSKLDLYIIHGNGYHICEINNYTIVHVHAERTGEEYTRRALNSIESVFKPDVVVLMGICYGIDYAKYRLGDVFISSSIKTYRINFRDSEETDRTDFEAEEEYHKGPNEEWISALRSMLSYRQIYSILNDEDGSKIGVKWETGTILSSNCLMSSKLVKDEVIKALGGAKPKPLGGEMEGGGLLKSKVVEEQSFDKWFIMKSICDWGEKKNFLDEDSNISELMKNSIQAMAMVHSWSVFCEMLFQRCFD